MMGRKKKFEDSFIQTYEMKLPGFTIEVLKNDFDIYMNLNDISSYVHIACVEKKFSSSYYTTFDYFEYLGKYFVNFDTCKYLLTDSRFKQGKNYNEKVAKELLEQIQRFLGVYSSVEYRELIEEYRVQQEKYKEKLEEQEQKWEQQVKKINKKLEEYENLFSEQEAENRGVRKFVSSLFNQKTIDDITEIINIKEKVDELLEYTLDLRKKNKTFYNWCSDLQAQINSLKK